MPQANAHERSGIAWDSLMSEKTVPDPSEPSGKTPAKSVTVPDSHAVVGMEPFQGEDLSPTDPGADGLALDHPVGQGADAVTIDATESPQTGEMGVTWPVPSAAASGSSASAPRNLPVVPGFEVLERLGGGGMGEVFKALQISLNRLVALKIIHTHLHRRTDQLARFRAEAEALARLQSPHIVQIFQVGEHEGCPFFIMELAEQDLQSKLGGLILSSGDAARLVATLAGAMHQAHQRGIIHRDLKPSNILLGADGTPKVADFGLVKFVDNDTGPTATTEAYLGTASYMAPEQARGKSKQVGPAADIYSLGAVLYEVLTGRPPFQGSTPVGTAMLVVNEEPIAPTRLQPGLPLDLETICLKCLQKSPERRYRSAADLADDLRRFLRNEPIVARPAGWAERLWYWSRRHPDLAALGGVAAAAVLAVVALSLLFGITQARAARREARAARLEGRIASGLMIDKGASLCERGNIGGMLWMARALADATRVGADDLEQNIRANLAGWRDRVCLLQAILVQKDVVSAVAFSPDGRLVLTGCTGGLAQLWNAETGKPQGEPIRPKGSVWGVAFRPDGRQFVLGCGDNSAQLRDVETGTLTRTLPHPDQVRAVAFDPTRESTLLTGCVDGAARLWDAGTGKLLQTFRHKSEVFDVAFSPDGRSILTGSMDRTARRWDVASGRELRRYEAPEQGEVRAVSFSPDGRTVLTGGLDMSARLWDTDSGRQLHKIPHRSGVIAVAFSADGGTILTASGRGPVQFWREPEHTAIDQFLVHPGVVRVLAVSRDGRRLLTGGQDGSARLWRLNLDEHPRTLLERRGEVIAAAFQHEGQRLVMGCTDGTVRLVDMATGQTQRPEPVAHQGEVTSLAFNRDGRLFLSTSEDRTAVLRDAMTGKPVIPPLKHLAGVTAGAFSPDSRLVLTGAASGLAQLWEVATGKPIRKPFAHPGPVSAIDFSADGRRVATGSWDRKARIWDVASGAMVAGPCPHPGSVLAVAFHPDGGSILTGCEDGSAQLWNASSGKPIGESLKHRVAVSTVAFSPDGTFALTGSQDGRAIPWDVATGKPLGPSNRVRGSVLALSFHPDGRAFRICGEVISVGSVPRPLEGTAETLRLWCQVITGARLDDDDAILLLDPDAWEQSRRLLNVIGKTRLRKD
ncbi:MAG: hypothetical protein NVSMB9_00980 [Isosphaeraceae bacterium]